MANYISPQRIKSKKIHLSALQYSFSNDIILVLHGNRIKAGGVLPFDDCSLINVAICQNCDKAIIWIDNQYVYPEIAATEPKCGYA